jgi:hypothetical protein
VIGLSPSIAVALPSVRDVPKLSLIPTATTPTPTTAMMIGTTSPRVVAASVVSTIAKSRVEVAVPVPTRGPRPHKKQQEQRPPPMTERIAARHIAKLSEDTLEKYRKCFQLKAVAKEELGAAVAEHFAHQEIDEAAVIALFFRTLRRK